MKSIVFLFFIYRFVDKFGLLGQATLSTVGVFWSLSYFADDRGVIIKCASKATRECRLFLEKLEDIFL